MLSGHTIHLLDSERKRLLVLKLEDQRLSDRVAMSTELLLKTEGHLVSVVGLIGSALLLQELCLQNKRANQLPLCIRVVGLNLDLRC